MISQDEKVKCLLDPIATRHGYLKGVLDSEAGRLTYHTYRDRQFTTKEALVHVLFVNDVEDTLTDNGFDDFTITTHFGEVIIRLPNEGVSN